MTEQELEQKIRDWIKSYYKAEYAGVLTVTKINGVYRFSIAIPSWLCLTSLAGDFNSDEDFLTFIYDELRKRNYMRTDFYRVERTEDSRENK